MSFTVCFFTRGLAYPLPEDPWDQLLAFLGIIIVSPWVLGAMLRRMLK